MTLAVHRVGDGEVSYAFLHGLFGQGRNWTSVARRLEPAGSLLVDLPNHGESAWTENFDYDQIADQVAELLPIGDAAGPSVTLVGHSLGGKVAMRAALRHPDLVGRLAVVDISPVAGVHVGDFASYSKAMLALDLHQLTERREIDAALFDAAPDPRIRGFLMQGLGRRDDGGGYRWRSNLRLLADSLDLIAGWPGTGDLTFDGPVLWLAGAESGYVRPEHLPAMRALFPRVRFVKVKGAGHWVHADKPDVVADLLKLLATRT